MESGIRTQPETQQSGKKPGSFALGAGLSVLFGVGLPILAIVYSRSAPKPVVVEKVKVVEKIVKLPEVRVVREPAPPPKPVVKEVKKASLVRAAPVEHKAWEGIWHPMKGMLPMFQIEQSDGRIWSIYAPNGNRQLRAIDCTATDDAVEIVADDGLFRVRFRLTVVNSHTATVIAWISHEDWLLSLTRVNAKAKTRQEALLMQVQIQANIKLTQKPQSLGAFTRGD